MLAVIGIIFLIIAVRAHPPMALGLVMIGALIWLTGFWLAAVLLFGGFALLVLLVAKRDAEDDWRNWQ